MTENQTPTPADLRAPDAERLAEIRERYSRTGPVNAYYEPPAQTMFADVLALLDRLAAAEQELAELRRDDEIAQDAIGDLNDKVVRAIKAQAAAERERDAARASVADLEQAQTTARAELERMTADRDFWKEQQQFAASVAGTIADLDEQTPAVRKILRREYDRRKATELHLDKTMFILQDAGIEQRGYERVPESVRLLVEQRDAALARSVLIEPDSRRTCPRCGTSWTVEVDACPRCQDAAPAGDGAAETGGVRADDPASIRMAEIAEQRADRGPVVTTCETCGETNHWCTCNAVDRGVA